MKHNIITAIAALALALGTTSCEDLDIAPKNIVTADDLLSNESGMDIYMARIYSLMPYEDFKYQSEWGLNRNGWLTGFGYDGTGETLNRDGICRAFTSENTPYWGDAFTLLRDINFLIENLPDYRSSYPEITYNHYLGEAYFARAMVFTAMAKRFGGIPLVTRVIQYPADQAELEVPRSSEEETWDQILADYDMAASLLMTKSPKAAYTNKYIALAYKSDAMLYAGSVAKYNETVTGRLTGLGQKTGVRVIGFDAGSWQDASKRYFAEAYKAASEVMRDGGYALYTKRFAEGDKEAIFKNLVEMTTDVNSPENIHVRSYLYPTTTHAYDAYNAPFIFRAPLSAGMCPTADFVELFEGFDRYADGTLKVTTGDSPAEGTYIMYDSPAGIYANAEPRLHAYCIYPGDIFKGQEIEIRAGIYTGATPIKPLLSDYSYANAAQHYQHTDAYTQKPKSLYLSPREGNNQEKVTLADGSVITAAGENGPFFENGEATLTGLYARKWLKDDASYTAREGNSDQHFILMRYARVMLNAAEAAVELSLAGAPSPDGTDLLATATKAVNDIRHRAGASLLNGSLTASDSSRDIVRKERRKELAMEHTTKWDLRRWRVNHYEGRDGFWGERRNKDLFSNNSRFRFRGIYPFYSATDGKWFFDVKFQWISQKTFEYNVVDYYFGIPSGEVTKSKYIDQQPNR